MSILTESFPDYIELSGKKYKIHTDFRVWLKFSELIQDAEQNPQNIVEIFKMVFYELPPKFNDAIVGMIKFYTGKTKEISEKEKQEHSKMVFDFTYDANMIFSAFMQQYKIDLTDANMHWWKFKSLFSGLSEDTQFIKAVQYRGMDISKIKDKEQKKFYQKMKALYKLPDTRSDEQKENDFINSIEKIFN